MARKLRPYTDIYNTGAWTTEPLYSEIQDNDDGTFVSSPDGNETVPSFVVGLIGGLTPLSGTRTVRFRCRVNVTGQVRRCNVRLLDSEGTAIQQFTTPDLTNTFTTYSFEVTGSIESYEGLQILVYDMIQNPLATPNHIQFAWVEFEIPFDESYNPHRRYLAYDEEDVETALEESWTDVALPHMSFNYVEKIPEAMEDVVIVPNGKYALSYLLFHTDTQLDVYYHNPAGTGLTLLEIPAGTYGHRPTDEGMNQEELDDLILRSTPPLVE